MGHADPLFLGAGSSPDTPSVRSAKKSDIRVLNSPSLPYDLHIPFHTESGVQTLCILTQRTTTDFQPSIPGPFLQPPPVHLLYKGIG